MSITDIGQIVAAAVTLISIVTHALGWDATHTGKIVLSLLPDIVGFIKAVIAALTSPPSGPGGTGSIDLSKSKLPPPKPPTIGGPAAAMVGLSVLLVLCTILYGCGAKSIACDVVHTIDDVCPFLVQIPDGGPVVSIPKSRMVALAKQEAQLQGLVDGGK